MMQRCLDLVLAGLGLLLVLPLCPLIGLLIKLDSRGSILYRGERIGKAGVAPQLTVVTMRTTVQSDAAAPVKDAHAASGVPNEMAAHETTAVRASSSNGP